MRSFTTASGWRTCAPRWRRRTRTVRKGAIEFKGTRVQLYTNDQASKAAQYKDLVVAYRNGAAVKLSDVGEVVDSVEDLRNLGLINNKRAVLVILYRQPGANIIETIDRVKSMLPQLQAALPADVQITPTADRSTTIRASLHDTELTLVIAVALVVMVVFLFLRNWRATLIPSVAVPISIIGTFAAMYLLGFSLDNLAYGADHRDGLRRRRRDRRAREHHAACGKRRAADAGRHTRRA